jgi:glycosyltransferase involved in cell wall biosynthesis
MVAEKGVRLLLDAVPAVADAVPDAHFLLLGEGDLADELHGRIETDRMADSVTLVSDRQPYELMPDIYSLASVFVYPSYTIDTWAEQFGFAAAEAMSCGVPVVTTECGSLPYVVGDTGVVCPEKDVGAIADGVVGMLSDDERRRAAGSAARERALSEFSIEQVAEAHEALLGRLSRRP